MLKPHYGPNIQRREFVGVDEAETSLESNNSDDIQESGLLLPENQDETPPTARRIDLEVVPRNAPKTSIPTWEERQFGHLQGLWAESVKKPVAFYLDPSEKIIFEGSVAAFPEEAVPAYRWFIVEGRGKKRSFRLYEKEVSERIILRVLLPGATGAEERSGNINVFYGDGSVSCLRFRGGDIVHDYETELPALSNAAGLIPPGRYFLTPDHEVQPYNAETAINSVGTFEIFNYALETRAKFEDIHGVSEDHRWVWFTNSSLADEIPALLTTSERFHSGGEQRVGIDIATSAFSGASIRTPGMRRYGAIALSSLLGAGVSYLGSYLSNELSDWAIGEDTGTEYGTGENSSKQLAATIAFFSALTASAFATLRRQALLDKNWAKVFLLDLSRQATSSGLFTSLSYGFGLSTGLQAGLTVLGNFLDLGASTYMQLRALPFLSDAMRSGRQFSATENAFITSMPSMLASRGPRIAEIALSSPIAGEAQIIKALSSWGMSAAYTQVSSRIAHQASLLWPYIDFNLQRGSGTKYDNNVAERRGDLIDLDYYSRINVFLAKRANKKHSEQLEILERISPGKDNLFTSRQEIINELRDLYKIKADNIYNTRDTIAMEMLSKHGLKDQISPPLDLTHFSNTEALLGLWGASNHLNFRNTPERPGSEALSPLSAKKLKLHPYIPPREFQELRDFSDRPTGQSMLFDFRSNTLISFDNDKVAIEVQGADSLNGGLPKYFLNEEEYLLSRKNQPLDDRIGYSNIYESRHELEAPLKSNPDIQPFRLAHNSKNSAKFLLNGSEFFKSLLDDMEELQSGDYLWGTAFFAHPDMMLFPPSQQSRLGEVLIRAIRRGVDIRIIHHVSGTKASSRGVFSLFKDVNAAATEQAIKDGKISSDQTYNVVMPDARANSLMGGIHQKSWIIGFKNKPSVAYMGSSDIHTERYDTKAHNDDLVLLNDSSVPIKLREMQPSDRPQRPTAGWAEGVLRLQGDIAQDVAVAVYQMIANKHPMIANVELRIPGILPDINYALPNQFPRTEWPDFNTNIEIEHSESFDAQLTRTAGEKGAQKGYHPWARKGDYSAMDAMIKAISEAENYILFVDQFTWAKPVQAAIAMRLRQRPNLKVVFFLNSNDNLVQLHLANLGFQNFGPYAREVRSKKAFKPIRDSWESNLFTFSPADPGSPSYVVHLKSMIIDDQFVMNGSMSHSLPGMTNNPEMMISISNKAIAKQLRRIIFGEFLNLDPVNSQLKTFESSLSAAIEQANSGSGRLKNWRPRQDYDADLHANPSYSARKIGGFFGYHGFQASGISEGRYRMPKPHFRLPVITEEKIDGKPLTAIKQKRLTSTEDDIERSISFRKPIKINKTLNTWLPSSTIHLFSRISGYTEAKPTHDTEDISGAGAEATWANSENKKLEEGVVEKEVEMASFFPRTKSSIRDIIDSKINRPERHAAQQEAAISDDERRRWEETGARPKTKTIKLSL